MTLQEFLDESREDIDRFNTHWRENALKEPDKWPLEMDAGDWFEQFIAFVTIDSDAS